MNERFVAVSTVTGLVYVVAFLSRDVISVSRGGDKMMNANGKHLSAPRTLTECNTTATGVKNRIRNRRKTDRQNGDERQKAKKNIITTPAVLS